MNVFQTQVRTLANVAQMKREAVYRKLVISKEFKNVLDETPLLSASIFGNKFPDLYAKELDKNSKQAMVKMVSAQTKTFKPAYTPSYKPAYAPAARTNRTAEVDTYKIPLKRKAGKQNFKTDGATSAKKKTPGFRKKSAE